MKRIKYVFLLIAVLALTFACDTYSEKDLAAFDKKIKEYVEKQPLKFEKSETGLYYYMENEGEGDEYIKFTDNVTFAYEGRLLNGELFDRRTRDNPVTFDTRVLIEGWKEAFAYLKKGGKAKLIIPPSLGYGDKEVGNIPKNSILVFDVEIIAVD